MAKGCRSYENFDFSGTYEPETLLKHFSDNGDAFLNFRNFKNLIACLLSDSQGKSYDLSESMLNQLFTIFDKNEDDIIDSSEFIYVYNDFIKPLVKPVTALLIIDVQNDFIDGSLALKNCPAKQDGNEVILVINNLLDTYKFDVVAYSLDFHPKNHISFFENINLYNLSKKNKSLEEITVFDTVIFDRPPEMSQKLWPVHCVQNTWGSELHKDLKIYKDSVSVYKGTNSDVDSYSAFFDNMKLSCTILDEELNKRNVTHVFICGLAFDYCVSFTAIDAAELGYVTVVIQDATKGTDNENISNMKEKLKSVNCVVAESSEINNLMSGKDIKPEFVSTLLLTLLKQK